MATRADINASGHIVSEADPDAILDTIVVNEVAGFVLGSVISAEAAGTGKIYDANSEADCGGIIGVSDAVYANAATASYYTDGDEVTGLAGLTIGSEYYADPTTGLPGLYSAIGSGEWTRLLGTATSATTLQLQIGAVFQKP